MNRKRILIALSSFLGVALSAQAQIKIGLTAGESMTAFGVSKKKTDVNGFADPELHKFDYKGHGFTGGAFIGYKEKYQNDFSEFQLAVYMDKYKSQNNGLKKDILSGTEDEDTRESLKRKRTLEFSVKLGRSLSDGFNIYGKAGGLYTEFAQQFTEVSTPQSGATKKLAWGGVVGIGIEKELENFNVGLAYDYHYYPMFKTDLRWGSFNNTYKLRPKYHNIYVTVNKAF